MAAILQLKYNIISWNKFVLPSYFCLSLPALIPDSTILFEVIIANHQLQAVINLLADDCCNYCLFELFGSAPLILHETGSGKKHRKYKD